MRRVEFHEEAVAEAQAAREWYESRSAIAASAFADELDRAVEQIAKFPDLWPPYLAGTHRYLLHRFPFSVVYFQEHGSDPSSGGGTPSQKTRLLEETCQGWTDESAAS